MTEEGKAKEPPGTPSAAQPIPARRDTSPPSAEETGPPPVETCREARNMAMLCHILGVVGFFGPLVIWLSEREKHRFVDEHGQAAINYQISLILYAAICLLLAWNVIGVFLTWLLLITHVVLIIMGAVKASQGCPWRYPIAIAFLR